MPNVYHVEKFLRRGCALLSLALLLSLTAWGQCFGPAQNYAAGDAPQAMRRDQ